VALVSDSFDLDSVEWRRITDPSSKNFRVDFEYSLLGYDLATCRLDMLLRYGKGGGHCRRHRHVAATVTLVLEGEQFLEEVLPDGSTVSISRKKGTYAMAAADARPHDEHGGENGGTVLLSMTAASDGILFEYFDEQMENPWTVSIKEYVDSWEQGKAYGEGPAALPEATLEEPEVSHEAKKAAMFESQEVAADDQRLEIANAQVGRNERATPSRYSAMKTSENRRNWRLGIGFAILIVALLGVAGYFITQAYERTLPPSNRVPGDMSRPALR
jgi:hypothetical protein